MSQHARRGDLRERMQRVATRPRPPLTARPPVQPPRPRIAADASEEAADSESHSRLDTLLAWGQWELTDVPVKRWSWFKQFLGGPADGDAR